MLDFKELASGGRGLEQLVRELLLRMEFIPHWSGQGADGGKDLLFDEIGLDLLGGKPRRWLVSCKDNAKSGAAVGVGDIDGLVEAAKQHEAQGFLLVCTTHPSSSVVARLDSIDSKELSTHYWDGVILERLLRSARSWPVAQAFMPVSADATGWQIFATGSPHRWVAVHRAQYFHMAKRVAGGPDFDLESLDLRLNEIESHELDSIRMRVRAVWLDDAKGGGYLWYVDCMVPEGIELPNARDLEAALESGVAREDGQFHSFNVIVRLLELDRAHFDIDHYEFYARLPPFV